MMRKCIVACAAAIGASLITGPVHAVAPVGTAFTYQGQIKELGVPADGTYDLQFRLYDSLDGGAPIGIPELKAGEEVVNGLFTVTLDFGPTAFTGEQRWLEVSVRRSGGFIDPYTVLSPRQPLTAAPYALYALTGAGTGGHWSANGTDIHNTNSGDVGIGTATPADDLHVVGTNPTVRLQDDRDPTSYTALQDDASIDAAQLEKRVSSGVPTVEISPMPIDTVSDARIRLFRRTNTSGAKVVLFNRGRNSDAVSALIGVDGYDSWFQADGGNFGIGTNAPAHPLHLSSAAQIVEKVTSSHTAGTWLDLENTSTGGKRWGVVSTGSANGEGAGHLLLRNITDGRTVMTLRGTGDVGVGTTTPQARLHVEGSARLTGAAQIGTGGTVDAGAKLNILGGTITEPWGGGYLVLGSTAANNLSLDNNEIQARYNGGTTPLEINGAGGNVYLIHSGTGRVGIGTGNPNPDVKLDVVTSGSETAIHGSGGAVGVAGWGSHSGGYFKDSNGSGEAWVGTMRDTINDCGIIAQSINTGGKFVSTGSGNYLVAATGVNSLYGNGSKDFVQNHPYEKNRVIHYSCLEGDEVGTYTRGSGQLANGEARIALGDTFQWVTNPDIGLTAHLTPRDQAVPLAVVSLTTEELVVRGPEGGPADLSFDYIVHGLRIGFEEAGVVRKKTMEAYIPSMASQEEAYAKNPELRRFNALERFRAMRTAEGQTASLDLTRAEALRDAITVYDPAIHQMPHPPRPGEHMESRKADETAGTGLSGHFERSGTGQSMHDDQSELQQLRDRVEALENLVDRLSRARGDYQPRRQ